MLIQLHTDVANNMLTDASGEISMNVLKTGVSDEHSNHEHHHVKHRLVVSCGNVLIECFLDEYDLERRQEPEDDSENDHNIKLELIRLDELKDPSQDFKVDDVAATNLFFLHLNRLTWDPLLLSNTSPRRAHSFLLFSGPCPSIFPGILSARSSRCRCRAGFQRWLSPFPEETGWRQC